MQKKEYHDNELKAPWKNTSKSIKKIQERVGNKKWTPWFEEVWSIKDFNWSIDLTLSSKVRLLRSFHTNHIMHTSQVPYIQGMFT